MKRILNSYLVFTSLIYRIVMFIIVPIVMIGAVLCIGGAFGGVGIPNLFYLPGTSVCIVVMMFLPMVEIISDNWIFGGIQSKEAEKLECLKSSGVGMQVLRNALSIDLLRKFLSAAVITGVSYGILYWRLMPDLVKILIENDWKLLLYAILVSYLFSVLGTVLARFGSMVWLNVMIAYLVEIIISVCLYNALMTHAVVYCVLSAILDVAVSILAVRIVMKKVEGSYYDK